MQQIKDNLKALGMAQSTIKTYSSAIKGFRTFANGRIITNELVNEYLDFLMLKRNYSARSRNLAGKILKFYCREFRGFEPIIFKAKESKPIPKICEDNEFSQILSVTPNIKHRLCLLLMRYSGLRRWEVIRVMKHHIQPDGRLFVKSGKGNKDRYTIIPPQILEQLNAYVSLLPADNPYIFAGQNSKHYNPRTPEQILVNAFNRLGWHRSRWFGCHALRHAFTIWAVDVVRLDYDEVSKMLGHSVRQTTQIYTQCRKLNLQRAIKMCGEVSITH